MASRAIKEDDVVGLHLYEPDDDAIASMAGGAMKAALHGHRAAAKIFGWAETTPEQIGEILAELDELFPPGLQNLADQV